MFAFYVHHLDPFIIQFGNGIGLRWYGTAYVVGILVAYQMLCWFSRKGMFELPVSRVGDFITGLALFGVFLGGRLGYALFYDYEQVWHDPLRLLRVWEGGMASHGGILGIVFYTLWYSKRHKVSWTGLGDSLVVAAPIGLFFGRIANFINGELYGRAAQVPWAVQFPNEMFENAALAEKAALACMAKVDPTLNSPDLIIEAARTSEPVRAVLATLLTPRHPSQIYEALLEGVVLFVALFLLRMRWKFPNGVVTGAFFILYAVLRIIGEIFREPDAALTLGLTRGQFLSLFMILMGAGFIFAAFRREKAAG